MFEWVPDILRRQQEEKDHISQNVHFRSVPRHLPQWASFPGSAPKATPRLTNLTPSLSDMQLSLYPIISHSPLSWLLASHQDEISPLKRLLRTTQCKGGPPTRLQLALCWLFMAYISVFHLFVFLSVVSPYQTLRSTRVGGQDSHLSRFSLQLQHLTQWPSPSRSPRNIGQMRRMKVQYFLLVDHTFMENILEHKSFLNCVLRSIQEIHATYLAEDGWHLALGYQELE